MGKVQPRHVPKIETFCLRLWRGFGAPPLVRF